MREDVKEHLRGKLAYLSSANAKGIPHLTVADFEVLEDKHIDINGWFCHQTIENISENPYVSILIRVDKRRYQLIGKVKDKKIDAMMEGFVPDEEEIPQVKYRLRVEIEKTMRMTDRPHSDKEVAPIYK